MKKLLRNIIRKVKNSSRTLIPFLLIRNDGSYVMIEVKAAVDIDSSLVRAKTDYANKIATVKGMYYIMMPSSKALTHKFI